MLVGGVIEDQLGDHSQAAAVRLREELLEVGQGPVGGVDAGVVGGVIAVIEQRRGIEGEQPERGHAEVVEVVELVDETAEIADAVGVAVAEGANVEFVEDGVAVPRLLRVTPGRNGTRIGVCEKRRASGCDGFPGATRLHGSRHDIVAHYGSP